MVAVVLNTLLKQKVGNVFLPFCYFLLFLLQMLFFGPPVCRSVVGFCSLVVIIFPSFCLAFSHDPVALFFFAVQSEAEVVDMYTESKLNILNLLKQDARTDDALKNFLQQKVTKQK